MVRFIRLLIKVDWFICIVYSKNEGGVLRMSLYCFINFFFDFNINVS